MTFFGRLGRLFSPETKPKQRIDVGCAVATLVFVEYHHQQESATATVTRRGRAHRYGCGDWWHTTGRDRLERAMDEKWIYADDGVYYNRAVVHHYTVEESEHFVEI